MRARFRVRDVVQLTGRGAALAGDVLDGEARVGMCVLVPGASAPLVIAAVEFVDRRVSMGDASVGLVFRDAPPAADLRRWCPTGTELSIEGAGRREASHAGRPALRRFWFRMARDFGVGVTAASEAEAHALADEARARYFAGAEFIEVVRDVDVRTLDAGHVLPNIGPPSVHGVWYPRLNI